MCLWGGIFWFWRNGSRFSIEAKEPFSCCELGSIRNLNHNEILTKVRKSMAIDAALDRKIVSQFVTPSKRQRLKGLLDSGSREKFINAFNSPAIFDDRKIHEFVGKQRDPHLLLAHYRALGMGGRVYVISEDSDWDGQKFQLSYILEECVGAGTDIVGYCYKTNTAFYEWHHSGTSYFLSPKK